MRKKILAAGDVPFENPAGIRQLEAFLKEAVAKPERVMAGSDAQTLDPGRGIARQPGIGDFLRAR